MPLVELVAAHPDLGEAAVELLEPGVAVTRRRTPGGAGPGPVAEQAERFVRRREVDRTRPSPVAPAGALPDVGPTRVAAGVPSGQGRVVGDPVADLAFRRPTPQCRVTPR